MKHIYLLSLCLCASAGVYAQTEQDTLVTDEKLVILLGTKVIESAQTVAQKVVVVNSETLKNGNAQTSADVLAQTGEVLVQKSQQGGGSPMLRGFEASRVLLVVDGVRMNNIIYRAGHLQNVITIDNQMLDRVEVLMGPSSTRYGSDALGGAMCFYTKKPTFATNKNGFVFKGNTNARWSSANMEKTGHIDLNFGFKKLAFLSSFTYSDFGDLRAGTVYPDKYPNFGKRTFYVQRFDGKDSMIQNTRPNYQIGTAYKQWGFMQKVAFRPNENTTHQLNIQLANSSNVPRYDRLTELGGNGKPSQAEWYYGPQKRNLLAYDMDSKGFHLGVNAQQIEESRHNRKFGSTSLNHRIEKVNVLGATMSYNRVVNKHNIRVGLDAQFNDLKSTAYKENVDTKAQSPLDTRYPDGKNQMLNAGAYATHNWYINDKFTLNDGVRLGYINLNSTFADTSFFAFPFKSAKQSHLVPNGNLGLVYHPSKHVNLSYLISTGFRAPNVDDLSKVFESSSSAKMLIVPNANLKPERTINQEIRARLGGGAFRVEVAGFYTLLNNAIVTDKFQYEGKDSVMYDGALCQVMANQNKRKAYIYGSSASVKWQVSNEFNVYSTLTYTYGRIKTDTTDAPLDHIAPLFGKTGVSYQSEKTQLELWANYNGAKKIKDYLLNAEDNEIYATADGMPAWWTLNLKGSYLLHEGVLFQAGVENILDRHYRVFASGMSAAGRNVFFALKLNW